MQHSQVLGNFLLPYAMLPELLIDDYHMAMRGQESKVLLQWSYSLKPTYNKYKPVINLLASGKI